MTPNLETSSNQRKQCVTHFLAHVLILCLCSLDSDRHVISPEEMILNSSYSLVFISKFFLSPELRFHFLPELSNLIRNEEISKCKPQNVFTSNSSDSLIFFLELLCFSNVAEQFFHKLDHDSHNFPDCTPIWYLNHPSFFEKSICLNSKLPLHPTARTISSWSWNHTLRLVHQSHERRLL